MKLTIDNRDLGYTIDTYGMFDSESVFESEADYLVDEYKLDINAVDFDFDHKGYVGDLAENSVHLLRQNLLTGDIVKSITLIKSQSPQFYNYTTDSYTALWCINRSALERYVDARKTDYTLFVKEYWAQDSLDPADTRIVAMLDYYTRTEYDPEEYNEAMFDIADQVAYEYIKPDEATQKLIDNVLDEREQ